MAAAMYCYVLAVLLSSGVTLVAAFLPMHSVPSCNLPHRFDTDVFHRAYSSLSPRVCGSFQTLFRCDRPAANNILASATSGNDADITVNSTVTGITLKMAFDSSPAWGVADLSETKSERFTSPESLDMVHRLRRESSAVLVGRSTVERDDCSLTVRRVELGDGKRQPVRVILDPLLRLIGGDYTILKDGLPTIIYHLETDDTDEILKASSESVTFVGLRPSGDRFSISPLEVVIDLATRGLQHIMVEGGPATARTFLDARVVDRAILVKAPIEFEVPVPAQMDENTFKSAGLQKIGTAIMGGDNVEYWTQNGLPWPELELSMWP